VSVASFDQILPFYAIELAAIAAFVHWSSGKCSHSPPKLLTITLSTAILFSLSLIAAGYTFHVGIPALISSVFRPLESNWNGAVRACLVLIATGALVGLECISDRAQFSSAGGYNMYSDDPRKSVVVTLMSILSGLHWQACASLWTPLVNPAHIMAVGCFGAAIMSLLVTFFATMTSATFGSVNELDFSATVWQLFIAAIAYIVLYAMVLFISLDMTFDIFVTLSIASIVVVMCQTASSEALSVSRTQIIGVVLLGLSGLFFGLCINANGIMKRVIDRTVWQCTTCADQT
jgi:hypothetical protein